MIGKRCLRRRRRNRDDAARTQESARPCGKERRRYPSRACEKRESEHPKIGCSAQKVGSIPVNELQDIGSHTLGRETVRAVSA